MKLKQEQIEKLRYELSIVVQPEKILIDLLDTIKSKDKRIKELEEDIEFRKAHSEQFAFDMLKHRKKTP
jgi:hypothetical protein